jgi:hypothetical protein
VLRPQSDWWWLPARWGGPILPAPRERKGALGGGLSAVAVVVADPRGRSGRARRDVDAVCVLAATWSRTTEIRPTGTSAIPFR